MSADFTPTMGTYTELKPFRYWCQKVLPLVYDDTLSYYELLCKVVDYLNKTMEDVDTLHGDVDALHDAYDELQGYVNDYFDNLDVQEQINVKLDEMVTDGTLLSIISPTIQTEVAAWLAAHVSPTTPAIDNTLAVNGAGADAQKTGLMIAPVYSSSKTYKVNQIVNYLGSFYRCIKAISTAEEFTSSKWTKINTGNELQDIYETFANCNIDVLHTEFFQGTLHGETGEVTPSTWRLTSDFCCIENTYGMKIVIPENYKLALHYYDVDKAYLSLHTDWLTGTVYISFISDYHFLRMVMAHSDDSTIYDYEGYLVSLSVYNIIQRSVISSQYLENFSIPVLRNGAASTPGNVNAVATQNIINIENAESIRILITRPLDSGHNYQIRYNIYDITEGQTGTTETNGHRVLSDQIKYFSGNEATIDLYGNYKGIGYQILEQYNNDWVPLRIQTNFRALGDVVHYINRVSMNRFILDVNGLKKPIQKIEKLGTLSNLQAFTLYDGKIYSVVEGAISEQAATFGNALRSADVEIGHANNLQLGESYYAYASGWNDNTIYKVSLSSLEVVDSITLPTTGYTTGVIDELNNIAYVLQRDTLPSTADYYKFIAYNITNETVVLEKYVNKFTALQSMDFYYGKIYAVAGLREEGSPNMMFVYNTNGDLLSASVMNDLIPYEIEGVFQDRNLTGDLYLSDAAKTLYKIS